MTPMPPASPASTPAPALPVKAPGAGLLALVALVAFAAGIGTQRALTPAPAATEARTAAATVAGTGSGAGTGSAGASATSPTTPPPPIPAASPPVSAPATAPQPTTAAALAALREAVKASTPRGTGKLTGLVRTGSGEPVPGVKVTAVLREREAGKRKRAADMELEEAVLVYAQREAQRRARTLETTSDASGAYAFESLPDVEINLGAELEGWTIRGGKTDARPGATVNFTAEALARIELTVLLPDGTAPREAQVELSAARSSRSHEWTPGKSTISAEPGTYMLKVSASPEDAEDLGLRRGRSRQTALFASAPQRVVLEAGGAPQRVICELKGRPLIYGRVVSPEGEDGADVEPGSMLLVRALAFKGATPPLEKLQERSGMVETVDAYSYDGTYELERVHAGSWLVGVSRGHGGVIVASQVVEVTDGPVRLDLAVPPLDLSKMIVLDVRDDKGQPIRKFDLQLRVKDVGHPGYAQTAQTVARKDGTRAVSVEDLRTAVESMGSRASFGVGGGDDDDAKAPADVFASATIVLEVHTTSHGRKELELPPGRRAGTYTLHFQAPATVAVTIRGYAGSGLEGRLHLGLMPDVAGRDRDATVRAVSRMQMARHSSSQSPEDVDAEGRAILGPVEPGAYVVTLSFASNKGSTLELARVPVTLASGQGAASVSIPPLHAVTIVGVPGAQVYVSPAPREDEEDEGEGVVFAMGSLQTQLDKEGKATLENLVAGEYVVRGGTKGGGWQGSRVRVPASGPVTLVEEVLDALLVRITRADGAFAQLGFEDRDYIVAIDGTELSGEQKMQLAFMAAMTKPRATVTVLRGGARMDLEVEMQKLMMAQSKGGGSVMPAKRPK